MAKLKTTKPELFIIESLDLDDEDDGLQEGEVLSKILHMSGKKNTKYYYIRTKKEFEEIVELFYESNYRYLHISCHGNESSVYTTFDEMSYKEFSDILGPCLDRRRIFVSACGLANRKFVDQLLDKSTCYSLVGPKNTIEFADAAPFWAAFYRLMFKSNERSMKHRDVEVYITAISMIFDEEFAYFRRVNRSKNSGYEEIKLRRRSSKINKKLDLPSI